LTAAARARRGPRQAPDGESTVADEVSKTPGPFDVERIKSLVALMRRNDLSEIDLHDGTMRIRLRRGMAFAPAATVVPLAAPVPAAAAAPARPTSEPASPARHLLEIKAPTPGTFYAKPNPESEPFVRVGSRVTPTTVVCTVEAMKLYNEIQAECTGVIVEVVAEDGKPVEYGQVLFRVDPTA
jgi:acetyl-CoA carboxylase biotin carboxyl carrier protein